MFNGGIKKKVRVKKNKTFAKLLLSPLVCSQAPQFQSMLFYFEDVFRSIEVHFDRSLKYNMDWNEVAWRY